jgi:hypothetical protein
MSANEKKEDAHFSLGLEPNPDSPQGQSLHHAKFCFSTYIFDTPAATVLFFLQ